MSVKKSLQGSYRISFHFVEIFYNFKIRSKQLITTAPLILAYSATQIYEY